MGSSTGPFARGAPSINLLPSEPPYTTPGLTANLVLRVLLSFVGNILCLVPLRILNNNSEFAAVVFIVIVELKNLETIVSSLLWRNDDTASWWSGYGYCDFDAYFQHFVIGIYVTCLLAIMRNLAQQVGMLRAGAMTVQEKRRHNVIQALIMFPLPIAQAALTWPLADQRYGVGTLVGCLYVASPTWLYLVFFVFAPVIVTLITTSYAVLVYIRFRQVAKSTESALSSNRVANRRAKRTKRRLYLMVLSILWPFTPISIAIAVLNVVNVVPIIPYSYEKTHHHTTPFPWDVILFIPSRGLDFAVINDCYIAIITTFLVFIFFGMTKDALNDYRKCALFLGLGKVLPGLHLEYDPDRGAFGNSSKGSSNYTHTDSGKLGSVTSSRGLISTNSSPDGPPNESRIQALNFPSSAGPEAGASSIPHPPTCARQSSNVDGKTPFPISFRNPFPLRTKLGFPNPLRLQLFHRQPDSQPGEEPLHPLQALQRASFQRPCDVEEQPQIETRVWSRDEVRLFDTAAGMKGPSGPADGVRVETALTRESHQTGEQ